MDKISIWTKITLESLTSMGQTIMNQVPAILSALLLIILGWLIAKIIFLGISKSLKALKFDKLGENLNIADFIAKTGIKVTPSQLVAKFVYWIILLLFFVTASDTLGWTVVSHSIRDLINYLPMLFSAIVIFVVGLYIANFIRKALNGIFDSLGVSTGKTVSSIAFYIIVVIISLTALTQAGIDTSVITSNVTLIIGGVILAFAVSFGLASKGILGNILSTFYSRNTFKVGQKIELGDIKGEIEKIETVSVTIKTAKGKVVVPSSRLVSENVIVS